MTDRFCNLIYSAPSIDLSSSNDRCLIVAVRNNPPAPEFDSRGSLSRRLQEVGLDDCKKRELVRAAQSDAEERLATRWLDWLGFSRSLPICRIDHLFRRDRITRIVNHICDTRISSRQSRLGSNCDDNSRPKSVLF